MSRRRLIALLILALLVALPSVAVLLVASTEWGLQAVASRLGTLGPVTIHIEGARGTLARDFHADSLDIRHRRVHLHFTGIDGHLTLAPLLWQTISVPQLSVQTALIEVPRVADNNTPWTPHFLPALMRIRAASVHIARGTLIVPNGMRFDATDADASGAVFPKQVRIYRGDLNVGVMHLAADGRLLAAEPLGFSGQATVGWHFAGQPAWAFTGSFDGSLLRLPVKVAFTAPFHAAVTGDFADLTNHWSFTGKGAVRDFDIVPFGGGRALGLMHGDLTLAADARGFRAQGTAESQGLAAGRFDVDFDGFYANRALTITEANVTHVASRAHGSVHGVIGFPPDERPQLDLSGSWVEFRWPLRGGEAAVRSAHGDFHLRGDRPYQVEATGELRAGSAPPISGSVSGLLDAQHIGVDHAELHAYGGTAAVRGDLAWTPATAWSLSGTASGLDVAQLRADLAGRLDAVFAASGRGFSADSDLDLRIESLGGKLRGNALQGHGRVSHADAAWRFNDVDIRLGRSRFTLDGSLGAQRDVHFGVTTEDLGLLSPDARGRISARGSLGGTERAPLLSLRGQGANIQFGTRSLRSFDVDADIDLRPGGQTRGRLRLHELRLLGRLIDTLSVELDGQSSDMSGFLNAQATGLQLALSAHGGFQDGGWSGTIHQVDAGDGAQMKLALEAAAPVEISADHSHIGPLCVKGSVERFCAVAELQDGRWQASFDAEKLPLQTLTAGLSQDIDYDGTIGIQARIAGVPDRPVTGTLHATLADAQLRHHLSNGREERFALGTGTVDAAADDDSFRIKAGLDAGAAGNLNGHLDGRRLGDSWGEFPIQGELALDTDGLGLLDVYVPGIDKASGRLTTKVNLTGTLASPEFQGTLQVRDGALDSYQVNLALRQVAIDARFNGTSLGLESSLHAGDGSGKITGELTWRDRQPFGHLHLEGSDLTIVDVPEARINASPTLDFEISGNRIDISGAVKLPLARLEPATITNAVLSSSDEVLVGMPVPDSAQRLQVTSKITLTLGDKVSVDTRGLKGRLTGSLVTQTDENQISRGTGEVNVAEGKYAAFGRNLDIARGRLIFNNGPIDDPGIDLRAQKVYPDVTAGVNVRGTLRSPRMTFFSEPAIPQSQIVSLILAGGSLESVQNSSRTGAARNDALAQGTAILAQQFGNRVGVEDIGVETDMTNETSLVFGRYLSPRLYVSYGIGLAEAINTVKLRYTVGDHWTVKTEAGTARSADLVYTIQK